MRLAALCLALASLAGCAAPCPVIIRTADTAGSGWRMADGTVLTVRHVVGDSREVSIETPHASIPGTVSIVGPGWAIVRPRWGTLRGDSGSAVLDSRGTYIGAVEGYFRGDVDDLMRESLARPGTRIALGTGTSEPGASLRAR